MASRFTQQKRLKIKKYDERKRKSSLRFGKQFWYSYNPTGTVSDERGKPVSYSLGSRAHAGTVVESEYLLKMFPGRNDLSEPGKIIAKAAQGNPRAVVLTKLMQGEVTKQKELVVICTDLTPGSRYNKVRLFVLGEETFFVREIIRGVKKRCSRSLIYTSVRDAMRDYSYGRVTYVEPVIEVIFDPDAPSTA